MTGVCIEHWQIVILPISSSFYRRLKSNVVGTYLPKVLHYNALQLFNDIRHVDIGVLVG